LDEQDATFLESLKPRCPPPHAISEYIFEDIMEHLERALPDSAREAIAKRFRFVKRDVLDDIFEYWLAKRGQTPTGTLMPTHLSPTQSEYDCFKVKLKPSVRTRARQQKQAQFRSESYEKTLEIRNMMFQLKELTRVDLNKSVRQRNSLHTKREQLDAEYERAMMETESLTE
jgi:hypothetical protein